MTPISRQTILVVEDDGVLAFDLCNRLSRAGAIPAGPARDLSEAMRLIAREDLDAALLDMDLGGHSSFPLCEALDRAGVRFVFLTGFGVAPAAELHGAPLLAKPVDDAALIAALAPRSPVTTGGRPTPAHAPQSSGGGPAI